MVRRSFQWQKAKKKEVAGAEDATVCEVHASAVRPIGPHVPPPPDDAVPSTVVRYGTWDAGAEGEDGDGGDLLLDARVAADVRGEVGDHGDQDPDKAQRAEKRRPPVEVL